MLGRSRPRSSATVLFLGHPAPVTSQAANSAELSASGAPSRLRYNIPAQGYYTTPRALCQVKVEQVPLCSAKFTCSPRALRGGRAPPDVCGRLPAAFLCTPARRMAGAANVGWQLRCRACPVSLRQGRSVRYPSRLRREHMLPTSLDYVPAPIVGGGSLRHPLLCSVFSVHVRPRYYRNKFGTNRKTSAQKTLCRGCSRVSYSTP